MNVYVQNRSLWLKIDLRCEFQQFPSRGNFFHFQNLLDVSMRKEQQQPPWFISLAKNFVRTRLKDKNYSMFHVTWTTFKFNRNQLGTVSAYVVWLWLIAILTRTLKWLSTIEIHCHNGFHLKPKAAINNTEISSLICETILIFNEHSYQYLLVVRSLTLKFFGE